MLLYPGGEFLKEKIIIHITSDIEDLATAYVAHRQKDLGTIRALLAEVKFDDILVLGHKMKGGGTLYKMDLVSSMGEQIEEAAKAMDKGLILRSVEALEDYFERLAVICDLPPGSWANPA